MTIKRPLCEESEGPFPHKPSPLETALLILTLAQTKQGSGDKADAEEEQGESRKLTRFRVSETTLKRLCGRKRVPQDYLAEVQEWLFDAGWSLFFTGSSYALIKSSSTEGWTRLSSKRIEGLDRVFRGEFDFKLLYGLVDGKLGAEED
jgi:hypothetical protein